MQTYPELRSGRFLVIADFEDPAHMQLFQLMGTSPEARCVLDEKRGRPETGRGCLLFIAGGENDTVVVSNTGARDWHLTRNWRPYDLLLMSVHVPDRKRRTRARGPNLELSIAGGEAGELVAVHASIPLHRGWNVVPVDLAEVAERIPLDNVRELRLSVSGLERPTELRIDDVLLAGHREDLLGDSSDHDGRLYVQRVGRRLRIGAGGRFELTFANGQIVAWYNLAADPYRLRNLVEGTTLGPNPMVLGSEGSRRGDFTELGSAVVVGERIMEMNSVRVLIACDWWFVDDLDEPLDDRPFQKWVYTIYPTGQMYVAVSSTAETRRWSPPSLGLAVTTASMSDGERHIHQPDRSEDGLIRSPYATLRSGEADAFLLYTLGGRPSGDATMTQIDDAETRRVSFVADTARSDVGHEHKAGATSAWVCHILLGQAGDISDASAAAHASAYAKPPALKLELGSPAPADGEHIRVNGFDQATGCYGVVPDRGRVRFVIQVPEEPGVSPVLRIADSSQEEAWVYVNHVILDEVARDRRGQVIFRVPSPLLEPTLVEVLLSRP